jgi:hypothetical protein
MRAYWLAAALVAACIGSSALAADWGLKEGKPDIKSAGPLAFGPDGVLLVGDTKSATIFAIDTGDTKGNPAKAEYKLDGVNDKLAALLGVPAAEVKVNDLAVNPDTGRVFLSISKGTGPNTTPAIAKIDETGKLSEVKLDKVKFAKVELPNPPADKVTGEGPRARNPRDDSITDLAYVSGKVLVTGLSTNAAPSTIREIQFPFAEADQGASLEIYHAAHGKSEDYAAIRTFVPFNIDGKPSLLAGFVCTPLVKIDLDALKTGEKAHGTTVAELGNMNKPLDMVAYKKDGKDYLLLTNSARGVMKISTADLGKNPGLTEPIKGGGTGGQTFETVKALKDVAQLDKLDDNRAVILVQAAGSPGSLQTIPLP